MAPPVRGGLWGEFRLHGWSALLCMAIVVIVQAFSCGGESESPALQDDEKAHLDDWASRLLEVWFASADCEGSMDSLLEAHGCSADSIRQLVAYCNSEPETRYPYLYQKLADLAATMELPDPSCIAADSALEDESGAPPTVQPSPPLPTREDGD